MGLALLCMQGPPPLYPSPMRLKCLHLFKKAVGLRWLSTCFLCYVHRSVVLSGGHSVTGCFLLPVEQPQACSTCERW